MTREELGLSRAAAVTHISDNPDFPGMDGIVECRLVKIEDGSVTVQPEIGVLGISGSCEEIAYTIAEKYPNLKLIIVTLDKEGAFALDCKNNEIVHTPAKASRVKSTVGAGDSFSACFLFHWLRGDGLEKAMECATELSGFVVTCLEAVPEYQDELKEKII